MPRLLLPLVLCTAAIAGFAADSPSLQVHPEGRFLQRADGSPFFYLGDTAWELLHRLDREETAHYLEDRAAKRFTVIQTVALAELDGLGVPNAYGHRPLENNDPTKPAVVEGPNNDYWDHVDAVFDLAEARGLVLALLPSWGDKWKLNRWGIGPEIFTPENAAVYGEWLGRRYRDRSLIWVLGGDRAIETPQDRDIIEAMAEGLRRGDGGAHLMTFHPPGGEGSSTWFHDAAWLDFNLRQNGHEVDYARYGKLAEDYMRTPVKPVMDGEPVYEDHPVAFKADQLGHTIAADVRRALYWDLFAGAFGHTYGHHSVWQMYSPKHDPVNSPLMTWREALQQPGAAQMQHGRALMESRPFFSRIPDDSLIVPARPPSAVPGAGRYRLSGTRDRAGTYAMIYTPVGRSFEIRTEALSGEQLQAWWFNPRTGEATRIGTLAREGTLKFTPPTPGEFLDWVLVLDDAAQNYPPPGTR